MKFRVTTITFAFAIVFCFVWCGMFIYWQIFSGGKPATSNLYVNKKQTLRSILMDNSVSPYPTPASTIVEEDQNIVATAASTPKDPVDASFIQHEEAEETPTIEVDASLLQHREEAEAKATVEKESQEDLDIRAASTVAPTIAMVHDNGTYIIHNQSNAGKDVVINDNVAAAVEPVVPVVAPDVVIPESPVYVKLLDENLVWLNEGSNNDQAFSALRAGQNELFSSFSPFIPSGALTGELGQQQPSAEASQRFSGIESVRLFHRALNSGLLSKSSSSSTYATLLEDEIHRTSLFEEFYNLIKSPFNASSLKASNDPSYGSMGTISSKEREILHSLYTASYFFDLNTVCIPVRATIAHSLALAFPKLPVILVRYSSIVQTCHDTDHVYERLNTFDEELSNDPLPSNLYVLYTSSPTHLNDADEKSRGFMAHQSVYIEHQKGITGTGTEAEPLNCIQSIKDLSDFVSGYDELPFEFERSLGTELCRCNSTFVPKALPNTPFFKYWESATSLVSAVSANMGSKSGSSCVLSVDSADSSVSKVRSNYLVVQRLHQTKSKKSSTSKETVEKSTYSSSKGRERTVNPIAELSLGVMLKSSYDSLSGDNPLMARFIAMMSDVITDDIPLEVLAQLVELYRTDDADASLEVGRRGASVLHDDDLWGQEGDTSTSSNRKIALALENVVVEWAHKFSLSATNDLGIRPDDSSFTVALAALAVTANASNGGDISEPAVLSRTVGRKLLGTVPSTSSASSSTSTSSSSTSSSSTSTPSLKGSSGSSYYSKSSTSSKEPKPTIPKPSVHSALSSPLNLFTTWKWIGSEEKSDTDGPLFIGDGNEPRVPFGGDFKWPDISQMEALDDDKPSTSSSSRTSTSSSAAEGKGSSNSIRKMQSQLYSTEAKSYQRWIDLARGISAPFTGDSLENQRSRMAEFHTARSVYVFGRHSSLISIKLASWLKKSYNTNEALRRKSKTARAKQAQMGVVVSVLSDPLALIPHQKLVEIMELSNNLICLSKMDGDSVAPLLASPEKATVALFQIDVFSQMLDSALSNSSNCGISKLEELLAVLMISSRISYFEMPTAGRLASIMSVFSSHACFREYYQRYAPANSHDLSTSEPHGISPFILLQHAAKQLGNGFRVRISNQQHTTTHDQMNGLAMYRVIVVNSKQRLNHKLQGNSVTGSSFSVPRLTNVGVSVYTLLHLGLVDKRPILKMYLEYPSMLSSPDVQNQYRPWNFFISLSTGADTLLSMGTTTSVSLYMSYRASDGRSAEDAVGDVSGQVGVSVGVDSSSVIGEQSKAKAVWSVINEQLHPHEIAGGKFSFVEHGSGLGYFSSILASTYPNSTVLSLERNKQKAKQHFKLVTKMNVTNNYVACTSETKDSVLRLNIAESPELFRFQYFSNGLLESFIESSEDDTFAAWGSELGSLLSSALTTFLYMPSSQQISWAMFSLFGSSSVSKTTSRNALARRQSHLIGAFRPFDSLFNSFDQVGVANSAPLVAQLNKMQSFSSHPLVSYEKFEVYWILGAVKVASNAGFTKVSFSSLYHSFSDHAAAVPVPIMRCDLVNMTRNVHHHYNYAKDGHTRTYTMKVLVDPRISSTGTLRTSPSEEEGAVSVPLQANHSNFEGWVGHQSPNGIVLTPSPSTGVGGHDVDATLYSQLLLPPGIHPNKDSLASVHLFRDRDNFPIPYTSIYGITLISALRLGLVKSQRDALYKSFINLPLFEDMAPWNIVLMGSAVEYIDFDTKDKYYDIDIPKAYQIMTVLANYKRTVEDFDQCSPSKASTVYGFPYVSDCVGGAKHQAGAPKKCPDLAFPVPCGDGHCHSDYIQCLRALSNIATELASHTSTEGSSASLTNLVADAIKSGVMSGEFNSKGVVKSEK